MDSFPCQATLNDYSVREDSNQRSAVPEITSLDGLDKRIWWFTVSKAAKMSSKMIVLELWIDRVIVRPACIFWYVSYISCILSPLLCFSVKEKKEDGIYEKMYTFFQKLN